MFPADLSRTRRTAVADDGAEARMQFAADALRLAADTEGDTIIWHFASKQAIDNIGRGGRLGSLAKALSKDGVALVSGVRILLSTDRSIATGVWTKTPLAAWWPGDKQLLSLDTTHRNAITALIGAPWRAPVWLAMSEIYLESPEEDEDSPTRQLHEAGSHPIVIPAELQEAVRRHSGLMTLSSNGIHDSHGPEFLRAVRPFLKSGTATPEAVALAALRAGWWPEKIPALMGKL